MKKKYLTIIILVLFTLNKLAAQTVKHIVVGNNVVIITDGIIENNDVLYSVSGSSYKKIAENKLKICDDRHTILWTTPSISNTNLKNIKFKLTLRSRFGVFKDERDEKTYKIVTIGNQIWMAENFAYKPNSGNYWAFDNDPSNVAKYGYLYDWETAKQIAPKGWHLPTKQEFETLLNNYGGKTEAYKALSKGGNSGFNVLFGGWRNGYSNFYDKRLRTGFWSATEYSEDGAWNCDLSANLWIAHMKFHYKGAGLSVRLIRDR